MTSAESRQTDLSGPLQAAMQRGDRLGALRLLTTVWPILTRRSMTTPFTGDTIVQ